MAKNTMWGAITTFFTVVGLGGLAAICYTKGSKDTKDTLENDYEKRCLAHPDLKRTTDESREKLDHFWDDKT